MSHLRGIVRFSLASLALAVAGLAIGAYGGGASGPADRPPATASLPAVNCSAPPTGVSAADWCPTN
jgi:hypothetical protein